MLLIKSKTTLTIYIIFTDSLSAIQALDNQKTENPLTTKLLDKLSGICENDVFCWLPSHICIRGNEEADKAAKEALSFDVLPFNAFKPLINDFIQDVWLRSWNDPANQYKNLFCIMPKTSESLPGSRSSRREEIVLARLRIGHTHIAHSYLLKGEEAPECIPCNTDLTVKHY